MMVTQKMFQFYIKSHMGNEIFAYFLYIRVVFTLTSRQQDSLINRYKIWCAFKKSCNKTYNVLHQGRQNDSKVK